MLLRLLVLLACFSCIARADEVALAALPDVWRYFKGTIEPPAQGGIAWNDIGYDDSAWLQGRPAFVTSGYGATALLDMVRNYRSVYLRREFVMENPAAVEWLVLRMDYSDGFAAFLNGREIARHNMPGAPGTKVSFNTLATAARMRGAPVEFDVSAFQDLIVAGTNVIAIQANNNGDFDFGVLGELLANFTRGPFVQNASTNAIQVIWRTAVPLDSTVEFGTNSALGFEVKSAGSKTDHVATLTDLQPDTTYFYRVRSGDGVRDAVSPIGTFRTLKTSGSLSFVVLGDSGSGYDAQFRIANVIREANPDLVLHAGDITYPSFTTSLADIRCLSVYRPHMRSTPYYFTIGNHDLYAGPAHYVNTFSHPTNDVPLLEHEVARTSPEHYYSFDHGDAHFTVLFVPYINQYKLQVGDPQFRWFTNDLATTTKKWKILLFHVPMDTSSYHRFDDHNFNGSLDRLEIKDAILPVASQYGVQLVFSGHDHVYERLSPTNGVHGIVTGGGGIGLYGFTELDVASSFFVSRHNCVKVTIDGDTLETQALSLDGTVFDSMTIQSAAPEPTAHHSTWNLPTIEISSPANGQGNIEGQTFDFIGTHIPAVSGRFSNLGRVFVNNDRTHLYIGLDRVMIYGNNNIFLFVDSPKRDGVSSLAEIGNDMIDPELQGADGLDFLANLSFTNFAPAIGCILGDELGDGQSRSFTRDHLELNIGQGAFALTRNLDDVAGIRLQQFHQSPQPTAAAGIEQNANFIELAIPLSELGGLSPGDRIKVGAVVGGAVVDTNKASQVRLLDAGFLGSAMRTAETGEVVLEGVEVVLAADPDEDNDGLLLAEEMERKTDPANPDSDGDQLLDGWEVEHQLDPLSASGDDGAAGDPDSDLSSNLSEQIAGTDPRDPRSVLRLDVESIGNDMYRLSWPAVIGRTYQLQVSDGPLAGYRNVAGPEFPLRAVAGTHSVAIRAGGQPRASQFYRLMVVP